MRKSNRAQRRSVRRFLALAGLDYRPKTRAFAPKAPVLRGFHSRDRMLGYAQLLANATGRPQTVIRDNYNKCYHIAEAAARNEKPSHVPARKRRPGGFVKSNRPYFPISRIGGVTVWPKKA